MSTREIDISLGLLETAINQFVDSVSKAKEYESWKKENKYSPKRAREAIRTEVLKTYCFNSNKLTRPLGTWSITGLGWVKITPKGRYKPQVYKKRLWLSYRGAECPEFIEFGVAYRKPPEQWIEIQLLSKQLEQKTKFSNLEIDKAELSYDSFAFKFWEMLTTGLFRDSNQVSHFLEPVFDRFRPNRLIGKVKTIEFTTKDSRLNGRTVVSNRFVVASTQKVDDVRLQKESTFERAMSVQHKPKSNTLLGADLF